MAKIIFICRANAERSQIAEAIFNRMSKKNGAISAGVKLARNEVGLPPGRTITELMLSYGYYHIERQKRKKLTRKMLEKADKVIVLMNGEELKLIPVYLKNMHGVTYWKVGSGYPSRMFLFPPSTYRYYLRWISGIEFHVKALVKEIG